MSESLIKKVQEWIADDPDLSTREQAQEVLNDAIEGDAVALEQLRTWFGPMLAFGTAGLRGPLGPGPSCMNRAVVMRAAAGLCKYLVSNNAKKIVVGYDARHRSLDFALDTVAIAAGFGLEALLLPRTLPTPVLAYSIGYYKADAGVMVTASHNPAQDNGYKVYLADGSQIVPPADIDIAAQIALVSSVSDLELSDNWESAEEDVVTSYVAATTKVADQKSEHNLIVASTPLHGVGNEVWTSVFDSIGFGQLHVVTEQAEPDPDFPTVVFPNPEEAGATDLLLALAAHVSADIAIAHDPDADRCAAGVRDAQGVWRLLRGDEVGALLGWWNIERRSVFGLSPLSGTYAASVVSSTLLSKIAASNNLKYATTLTGFKWISKVDGLVFGYEEALGYCVDPGSVRDKDGISASTRLCEMAAHLKATGKTVDQILDQLAKEFGLHRTDQLSVRMNDLAAIPAAVSLLRSNPPTSVAGLAVVETVDLKNGWNGLPPTDGIMLILDGGRVIARPSGTEPKLKCYLEVVVDAGDLPNAKTTAESLIQQMKKDMAVALGVN
ncbi:MAG: hypothetical protein RLZZ426_469 [Actinomycetota bacterium]